MHATNNGQAVRHGQDQQRFHDDTWPAPSSQLSLPSSRDCAAAQVREECVSAHSRQSISENDVIDESKESDELHDLEESKRTKKISNVVGAENSRTISLQERALAELNRQLANGETPRLSLPEHVLAAYEHYSNVEFPEWQTGVFHFVRMMRAAEELADSDPEGALDAVERVLAGWIKSRETVYARASKAWKKFFFVDEEDARAEFLDAWGKVRCVPGRGPWQHAWTSAHERPISFSAENISLTTNGYKLFLSFAGWLQVATGPSQIWLPVANTASMMGVKPMTISRYRRYGVKDGFLIECRKHTRQSATRFLFDVRRVPMLKTAAHNNVLKMLEEHFGNS